MKRKKAWEGRLGSGLDPIFEAFNASLPVDQVLLDVELEQDRAWARALNQAGVYSQEELQAVLSALDHMEEEARESRFPFLQSDEDVHMAIERRMTELCGEAGERLQTGRSRNDQVGTSLRMYLKEEASQLRASLVVALQTLINRAQPERETPLPGLTHLQPAQVLSLAHYLMSAFWALARDLQRLDDCLGRLDLLPLGSGSLAGTSLPVDRDQLARELRFSGITQNSLDAVSDRDGVTELSFVLAQMMQHLSRYAEDWILWCSPAWGFLEIPDSLSTGSSLMPQKKNPDSLELIRGKAATALGQTTALLALQKGLPTSYNKDLQEDKAGLFALLTTTWQCVEVFRRVTEGMQFNRQRMAAALDDGLYATDLADYLVQKGLPFRKAHEVVGRLVRGALEKGIPLSSISVDRYRQESDLFEADVTELYSPASSLKRREIPGGTGPDSVAAQIQSARDWMSRTVPDSKQETQ